MVSNKTIHRALRTRTTLMKQLPIREFFHFHHLPKLYFGFKLWHHTHLHIPISLVLLLFHTLRQGNAFSVAMTFISCRIAKAYETTLRVRHDLSSQKVMSDFYSAFFIGFRTTPHWIKTKPNYCPPGPRSLWSLPTRITPHQDQTCQPLGIKNCILWSPKLYFAPPNCIL